MEASNENEKTPGVCIPKKKSPGETRRERAKQAQYVSSKQAELLTGLYPTTLRKMFDNGTLKGFITPSGHRRYSRENLQNIVQGDNPDESRPIQRNRNNYLYARVSTRGQLADLQRQATFLQESREGNGVDYTLIQDVGSGINFKRRGLQTILDACLQRCIGEVVIAHRDRLCRFAYELIESIIVKSGGKLTVLSQEESDMSSEKFLAKEMSDDLLSIVHIFNCRQMGKRSYNKRKREGSTKKGVENDKDTDDAIRTAEVGTSTDV